MKTVFLRTLFILILPAAGVLWWVHWSPSVETILTPLELSEKDFELKSTRGALGTQPVLLIVDLKDSNVYSRYVAEVLKAEGIFCFEMMDISSTTIDDTLLREYPLVITAGSSLTLQRNKARLEEYVRLGGNLLMIGPPADFDSLLGIQHTNRTITDGYILFDSASHIARGLSHAPLQFFGTVQLFESTRANIVARLAPERSMIGSHVGIGFSSYGAGRTGFISFDLGQSIVMTRQGKPPLPGTLRAIDRDGDGVFKTADLYYDSFDYANRAIPQADEQQKIFVNLIFTLLDGNALIPRVWYFPNAVPAVALLTGDHHGWASQLPMSTIATWLNSVNGHYTFFVYPDEIDTTVVHDLASQGHAISPHLYYPVSSNRLMRGRLLLAHWFSSTSFFRPRLGDLESEIDRGEREFEKLNIGTGRSSRFHYLIWWGWTETPQLLAQKGYRLDFSISGIDPRYGQRPNVVNHWNSPMGYGYVNGSGQPMKVITPEGNLVDLFCQLTQFEDDVVAREYLSMPPNDSVTTRRLIDLSTEFIDQSINGYHAVLVWNFHPEHTIQRWPPDAPPTGPWIQATVNYLKQHHVPMLSSNEWLAFVQARRSIVVDDVRHDPSKLTGAFTVRSGLDVNGVTLMIPVPVKHTLKGLSGISYVLVDEVPVKPLPETNVVNGMEYLTFQVDLRAHRQVRVSYRFMQPQ